MFEELGAPYASVTRHGTPTCPQCKDGRRIEPLLQVEGVWHVRCLRCGYGFRLPPQHPTSPAERRRVEERRAVARSGRRATDLDHPVTCHHCEGVNVHGWLRTQEALWARCHACGRVQRVTEATGPAGP
jgi:uncharacterized Zn finger protein